jgi:hypothetical protein
LISGISPSIQAIFSCIPQIRGIFPSISQIGHLPDRPTESYDLIIVPARQNDKLSYQCKKNRTKSARFLLPQDAVAFALHTGRTGLMV